MKSFVARAALFGAAAFIAWYALNRTRPPAPKPAELLDEASRAVLSWRPPDTLGSGETLDRLLQRGGLDPVSVREIIAAASEVQSPRRMPAGMAVQFIGDSGAPMPREVVLRLAIDRRLHVTRDSMGGWRANEERLPWATDTVVVRGAVRSNLYDAFSPVASALFPGDARDELVIRVATVYESKLDMTTALWVGDSVYALVERKRGPESATRVDHVLATRLFVHGRTLEAFVFPDSNAKPKYYDAGGKSLATRFLRMPIEFARISSRFNPARFHPILKTWRAHRGTDYAAVSGTPIRAIGDGRVVRAVYNPGGYGNMVDVDHGTIVTRYGHLRAFGPGIRAGMHVVQGQTVGYVGMTGLATAPHLHFEVLKSGVQVNPERELAKFEGKPLPDRDTPAFNAVREVLVRLLGRPEGVVQLAQSARGR